MLRIGLDTESLHLWFQNKRMDIFGYIEAAHSFGADGVMINLIKDFNLDPEWGTLGSDDPEHLRKVRALLDRYSMFVEFATKGLEYDHMKKVIEAGNVLGVDIIRTYIPITLNAHVGEKGEDGRYDLGKIRLDFDPAVYDEAVVKLKALVPLLKKHRVKIGLENHEYETSEELVKVVEAVDSPWIGLHYDFGNSMMAWEDPEKAARNMGRYTVTTHFKDHIVIPDPGDKYGYVVCGVPAGTGNIDLRSVLEVILDQSQITRLIVEMCYPYCAQFKRSPGAGGISAVGEGCFKVEKPLFDPELVQPRGYYYPQEVSEELLEKCLKLQWDGAKASVEYTRRLIAELSGN